MHLPDVERRDISRLSTRERRGWGTARATTAGACRPRTPPRHSYAGHWVAQQYLPDIHKDRRFYQPSDEGYEAEVKESVEKWRTAGRSEEIVIIQLRFAQAWLQLRHKSASRPDDTLPSSSY